MAATERRVSDGRRSVVTPGNHDGVHLGHQALLAAARRRAVRSSPELGVVAMTFDPHPAAVIAPEHAPDPLTTLPRRCALLEALGADRVVVQTFDRAFAALSPTAFAKGRLVDQLGAAAVIIGPDFRFGSARAGDGHALTELGEAYGFAVDMVAPVEVAGRPVSSTRIRSLIREGRVGEASALLGRPHDVGGTVVKGDQRGRTIGFPTANLDCEPILLPSDGVYAVVARVDGEIVRGVANLGVRPTFAAGRSVEVHLFDFEGDIYGAEVRVGFVGRIRGERKFDGLEALKTQIAKDAAEARANLEAADPAGWRWL